MLKFMLDTNIVIYTVKNRPQRVREAFEQGATLTTCQLAVLTGAPRFRRSESEMRSPRLVGFRKFLSSSKALRNRPGSGTLPNPRIG